MTHKFKVGDTIRYCDSILGRSGLRNIPEGTITKLASLKQIVEGDCTNEEAEEPWYQVEWGTGACGNESEGNLVKVEDE